jgi:hypothetical protein
MKNITKHPIFDSLVHYDTTHHEQLTHHKNKNQTVTTTHLNQRHWSEEKYGGGGVSQAVINALMHSKYKTSASTSNNDAITGTGALKLQENVLNCSNDGFLNS